MAIYVALLRGINVGGNVLKMDRLREVCEGLGFKNVRTYVQSGNVVFEADSSSPSLTQLEHRLADESRLPVVALLRTDKEMQKIIAGNPFLARSGIDHTKLHVTFLSDSATKEGLTKLSEISAGADEFHAIGKQIYVHCPNGYSRTKLTNNAIEKKLALKATTRNWNTVVRLYEMASGK